jgi:ElaB/YqjD/DUF883 family membrane-anchored ribosome-binding protein
MGRRVGKQPLRSRIPAVNTTQQHANNVAQQIREYGEKAQEAAKKFKPFTEKSMRDQPMATLAVASLIGFVLGALWKR